jgi:hypothetical protein
MIAHRHGEITERAYAIWEREGRPEGKAADHWQRAEAEIAAESAQSAVRSGRSSRAVSAAPKPAAAGPKRAQRK